MHAAEQRGRADQRLDLRELRGLAGPDQVAAQGDLESGGQAEAVDRCERRDRQVLEPLHQREELRELRARLVTVDALEDPHVGASPEAQGSLESRLERGSSNAGT